jgi:hypothetical protein
VILRSGSGYLSRVECTGVGGTWELAHMSVGLEGIT